MALDENIRILSGVTFFDGFTQDQLRLLAFSAEPNVLIARELLFLEGVKAECAFVLTSGVLRLFAGQGRDVEDMGTVRKGALLGAVALITDTTRPTSAFAQTRCTLLKVTRKDFRRVLEEYPELAALLHKRIADEFQAMVENIGRLAPRFS